MESTERKPLVRTPLLNELKRRNRLLFFFGVVNILAAIVCVLLMLIDKREVSGVNTWTKPFKFFFSVAVFSWTISWYLDYLDKKVAVKIYTYVVVVSMTIELLLISYQAARGVKSHFNINSQMDAMIFSTMGIIITIFTLWTFYIFILFMTQKRYQIPEGYLWGIRAGLFLFIVFAFEGGIMASQLQHTVGAEDGAEGMPLLNRSSRYGDLRIAHFFGMHALQILPIAGYFLFKTKAKMFTFSLFYFLLVSFILIRALQGMPLY
jgi:hypothetical protein